MSWSSILKCKPGLFLPQSPPGVVIIRNSQWLVFGAVTWSLRFQEYSKQTQWGGCEGSYYMYIQLGIYYTCMHVYSSNIHRAGDYLILSMLWGFFFCRALKHSGRLIKSIPQAAALIGSHTEKCSPTLSYITRKMRGCFEVHQSYCFFPLAPSTEGSWCPNAGTAQRRGEIKEAYSNCAACTECIAWVGVPSCTHITLVFLLPAAPLVGTVSSLLIF